ncbi:MAG: DNA-binding protein YbiB [Curvibacter sp.]|nr:DNA-binding protein YbiB [Curvibacter sp.]
MGISAYIKEIGRGKDGARALSREQACDLLGQVLDGQVSDLEIGAFCLAMRIKGETPAEMAGFLDALHVRLQKLPHAPGLPVVVLPSYNGARKLPVLTPLLALLLARRGGRVLVHGTPTEDRRVAASSVLEALGIPTSAPLKALQAGEVAFAPTETLLPGLKRLLDVRRVVGLRNPAHSLVKLMSPCAGPSVLVSSYTHPEYALSMAATLALTGQTALLLRGTEGEVVADARRTPEMTAYLGGQARTAQTAQAGPLQALPGLPQDISAESTARYIRQVMAGELPVPGPIACQVDHILQLAEQAR